VKFPVALVGRLVARRIEQGSLWVAAAGAIGGAFLGLVLLWGANEWRDEPVPLHPIAAGLIGAFVGVFAGPALHRPAARPVRRFHRPRGVLGEVRVTNLNVALGRILVAVLFFAAVGGLVCFALTDQLKWPQAWAGAAGVAGFLAGAAVVTAFPVLWVDVGEHGATFRRLFGSRTYARDEVRQWGFAPTRGKVVAAAPPGPVPFVVETRDGTFLEVVVGPEKAAELEAAIQSPRR
jgi:hypothetical protein